MASKLNIGLLTILLLACASSQAFASTRAAQDSQPLVFLPFEYDSSWHCPQGNNGTFTHTGGHRYAYDFDMGSTVNSSSNPAYGQNVYSPVNGVITDLRQGAPDFSNNGSSNPGNNHGWGNTIAIQPDNSDYHVRLSHLRAGSIPSGLRVGDRINQGDLVGEVGSSGISTHPHLDMALMTANRGGNSVRFEFVEGRVSTGTWITSELEAHKYIIDNDRRVNLGAPLDNPNNWYRGSFSLYSERYQAHADDYRRSSSTDDTRYYWAFTMDGYEGDVDVYSNSRVMASNDSQARFRVYGGGISRYRTVNQTRLPGNLYHHLGMFHFEDDTRYTVRAQRRSGRLCADSIVIYLDESGYL